MYKIYIHKYYAFFYIYLFVFLGPHPLHVDILKLGVESDQQA